MDPVSAYLAELRDIRTSGAVPETSGYGALATLLNDVGHKLNPKVRCTINPRNSKMGRRIAAILLLEPALNSSYERVKAEAYTWRRSSP